MGIKRKQVAIGNRVLLAWFLVWHQIFDSFLPTNFLQLSFESQFVNLPFPPALCCCQNSWALRRRRRLPSFPCAFRVTTSFLPLQHPIVSNSPPLLSPPCYPSNIHQLAAGSFLSSSIPRLGPVYFWGCFPGLSFPSWRLIKSENDWTNRAHPVSYVLPCRNSQHSLFFFFFFSHPFARFRFWILRAVRRINFPAFVHSFIHASIAIRTIATCLSFAIYFPWRARHSL